jgi:hypothetical protein
VRHGAISARPDGTKKVAGRNTFIVDVELDLFPRGKSACAGELHRDGIDNYIADIHHGKIELNMTTAIYRTVDASRLSRVQPRVMGEPEGPGTLAGWPCIA